jgi:hypothetical protein
MKFNSVSIVLTNVTDEDVAINVVFDPPLPEDENDIEDQPCLNMLEIMLDAVEDIEDGPEQYLQ